jgi:hypothetical protein
MTIEGIIFAWVIGVMVLVVLSITAAVYLVIR